MDVHQQDIRGTLFRHPLNKSPPKQLMILQLVTLQLLRTLPYDGDLLRSHKHYEAYSSRPSPHSGFPAQQSLPVSKLNHPKPLSKKNPEKLKTPTFIV